MASDPNIVTGTPELPSDPEGLIKPGPFEFPFPPPEVGELRRKFDNAREMTREARQKSQVDRDYFDGPKQLNSEVRSILRMRGQPPIYTNQIRPAINGILGVMQGSQVDPRAFPRNPDDEEAATVASKVLRFIADTSSFDEVKLDCAENYWIEGTCAVIIESDGENITADQVRWEEFFYDPRSRRHDFKDATYLGFAQWLNTDYVRSIYPEQYAAMGDPMDLGGIGIEPTWEDRPDNMTPWVDSKQRRLMVVTLFYLKGGEWFRCVYCAAGVFEHDRTGYVDDKGRSICPIEAVSYGVNRDNERYGHVQDMKPIQDEVNASRSRSLHLANSRRVQKTDPSAPPVDANELRMEAGKADGIIPPGYQMVPNDDMLQANLLRNQEAKSELQRMAPTPATLGRDQGASSGRERLVLQQAGMTELARPMGRLDQWAERCYRQMWFRAQQFWTAPKWIRVTDDPRAAQFQQINEPVFDDLGNPVLETDAYGMPVMRPVLDEAGQPVIDPMTQQPAMQPVQKVRNRISELDLDIIIETTPDTANLQGEIFSDLVALVERVGLQAVFSPEFEIMIEMSALQNKEQILERLKAGRGGDDPRLAQAQQIIEQLQAELQELRQGQAAAETEKKLSETAENYAQVSLIEAQARNEEAEALRTMTEPFTQTMDTQENRYYNT